MWIEQPFCPSVYVLVMRATPHKKDPTSQSGLDGDAN